MKTEWTASVCQHCLLLQDMIQTVQPRLHLRLVTRSGNILKLVMVHYAWQWLNIYYTRIWMVMCSVACLCLSVYPVLAVTFGSLDLETSFLLCRYLFSQIHVSGHWWRSRSHSWVVLWLKGSFVVQICGNWICA